MLPIRDHNPSERTPYVTYILMALNIGIFLSYVAMFNDAAAINGFFRTWAMIPANVSNGDMTHTLFTSMFLHGGWMHLAGNMLFLWIFGDNLEEEFGHFWYLVFYLASGFAAGYAHVLADPGSTIPTVGASGAIAGVMGGYLLLFPRARVDILLILIVFFRIFSVPAWLMLGVWFGLQLFNGVAVDPASGGVAYWAHAGGFIIGFVFCIPSWIRHGATNYWRKTDGHPPHPEATYRYVRSNVPKVARK